MSNFLKMYKLITLLFLGLFVLSSPKQVFAEDVMIQSVSVNCPTAGSCLVETTGFWHSNINNANIIFSAQLVKVTPGGDTPVHSFPSRTSDVLTGNFVISPMAGQEGDINSNQIQPGDRMKVIATIRCVPKDGQFPPNGQCANIPGDTDTQSSAISVVPGANVILNASSDSFTCSGDSLDALWDFSWMNYRPDDPSAPLRYEVNYYKVSGGSEVPLPGNPLGGVLNNSTTNSTGSQTSGNFRNIEGETAISFMATARLICDAEPCAGEQSTLAVSSCTRPPPPTNSNVQFEIEDNIGQCNVEESGTSFSPTFTWTGNTNLATIKFAANLTYVDTSGANVVQPDTTGQGTSMEGSNISLTTPATGPIQPGSRVTYAAKIYCDPSSECTEENVVLHCIEGQVGVPPTGGSGGTTTSPDYGLNFGNATFEGLSRALYRLVYAIGVGLGVSFIIKAGYTIATSQANPNEIQKGKEDLTAAIAGTLFIFLAMTSLRIIINLLLGPATI